MSPYPRHCALALQVCAVLLVAVASAAEEVPPREMPYETAGEIPSLDPLTYRMNTKAVRITDNSLEPRVVTLDEGQLVAWISYTPIPSTVVFGREVARSMICHSLVNFSIQDEEIRSAEIHAGEFASFCELKPGRYRYSVLRAASGKMAISAAAKLEGEIVVKGRGR